MQIAYSTYYFNQKDIPYVGYYLIILFVLLLFGFRCNPYCLLILFLYDTLHL